jgi:transposase
MVILAIDLGKSKSVACEYEAGTDKHEYEKLETTPEALRALLGKVSPDRVVIEVCPQAGWVADVVRELGIELQVANPNHEGWRWRNVKRKTDRVDALKLARLSAVNQLPLVYMPAKDARQWRSLILYRQSLIKRRTGAKNRIRSILDQQGLRILASGKKGWTEKGMEALRALARPLDETNGAEFWRGELWEELRELDALDEAIRRVEKKLDGVGQQDRRVQLLDTIPGVGPRLAEMVVAVIDEPSRFARGKQVGSYVGLTPRQYQSGNTDRQGRISGQGHRELRAMLIEVSWLGLRHNPWMREVYERVRRGSQTRKKVAIVAVARRLLVRCWAMLRDATPWRRPPVADTSSAQAA